MKTNLLPTVAASICFAFSLVFADTITWDGGTSGTFSDTANWIGGEVPVSTDTARFTDAGEVVVEFSTNATVDTVAFEGTELAGDPAKLTFNADGRTFTTMGSLILDASASDARVFVFNGGTLAVGVTLGVNNVSALRDSMTMEVNDGTVLTVGNQLGIGRRSIGILSITGGSTLAINDQTLMGHGSSGDGRIIVSGSGSEFNQNDGSANRNILVGFSNNGQGSVEVLAGGKMQTVRSVTIATAVGSSGSVLVSGTNSSMVANVAGEGLFVGGRTNAGGEAGGTGLATFAFGGSGDFDVIRVFANDPSIDEIGTLVFNQSGGVIANSATFESGSVVRFGLFEVNQAMDLTINGSLSIAGAYLEAFLEPEFVPVLGNSFSLIGYDSLAGTFANQDGEVLIDGIRFAIDYSLGGEDVIGLTVIPEPSQVALVLAAVIVLLMLRRRKPVA